MAPNKGEKKVQDFGFCSIKLLLNELISLKFILGTSLKFKWYLTINKIQVEFEREGYASIWTGEIAPDRSEKMKIYGFYSIT